MTISAALVLALAAAATPTPPPSHAHAVGVQERGDHVMGFDHAKTTHHFRLREAVHEFLRFQIHDHRTGDSARVE